MLSTDHFRQELLARLGRAASATPSHASLSSGLTARLPALGIRRCGICLHSLRAWQEIITNELVQKSKGATHTPSEWKGARTDDAALAGLGHSRFQTGHSLWQDRNGSGRF